MGAVYLAEHPLIGKKVALKVIHRELAGNREVVQRFFQEAKAVNKIGNEHIVEIHDFGVTPENDHFYIMEYLEGITLASALSRERTLETMRALHIGAQIAHALASAHAAGVVHRDLKPDNIMLMQRMGDPDFVKVLDFGLAKMFAETTAVKTAVGVLLGTPQYMSPEACESKRGIDHRTDVYALGILLFQMLTGRLPFDGETMGEVLVKQVTQLPPAPRALNPSIPPAVEQILLRCLAKSPDNRFQNMKALRDALLDPDAYLRTSPPMAPARSLAPGETRADARTVIAHAEAVQKAKLAGLPPPPPPRVDVDDALFAETVVGMGATGMMRAQTGVPDMAQPHSVKNHTMRIATPLGYSSRPPRKMWPIVLVMGLLLGLGGGAFAVAWFGRKAPAAVPDDGVAAIVIDAGVGGTQATPILVEAGAHGATGSALVSGTRDAAPAATVDSATPGEALAKVTIDSKPPGATVHGPDGGVIGKTPLKFSWPMAAGDVIFELRRPGYRNKPTPLNVSGNTAILVELDRLPSRGSGTSRGSAQGNSDTGLMVPE
ncbi:MAG: serine/threonine protein kinase [Deltaproteobacteria bacterium]|nr:serine/threonine protein kinase [Deltaproteobacteria bacterium]MDQ3300104.1 protein kinase [Myxococcota bacterium]